MQVCHALLQVAVRWWEGKEGVMEKLRPLAEVLSEEEESERRGLGVRVVITAAAERSRCSTRPC